MTQRKISFSVNKAKPTPTPTVSTPAPPSIFSNDTYDESIDTPTNYWKNIHSFNNKESEVCEPINKDLRSNTKSSDDEDESFGIVTSPNTKNQQNGGLFIPAHSPSNPSPNHGLLIPAKHNEKPAQSRYISNIKHTSKRRELEFELINEKKIQKERLEDLEKHPDKEVFVTSAYKKKLAERQKFKEELDEQDRIDQLKDVSKQSDLSAFHSSLLSRGQSTRSKGAMDPTSFSQANNTSSSHSSTLVDSIPAKLSHPDQKTSTQSNIQINEPKNNEVGKSVASKTESNKTNSPDFTKKEEEIDQEKILTKQMGIKRNFERNPTEEVKKVKSVDDSATHSPSPIVPHTNTTTPKTPSASPPAPEIPTEEERIAKLEAAKARFLERKKLQSS